jgi:hypothetical protein
MEETVVPRAANAAGAAMARVRLVVAEMEAVAGGPTAAGAEGARAAAAKVAAPSAGCRAVEETASEARAAAASVEEALMVAVALEAQTAAATMAAVATVAVAKALAAEEKASVARVEELWAVALREVGMREVEEARAAVVVQGAVRPPRMSHHRPSRSNRSWSPSGNGSRRCGRRTCRGWRHWHPLRTSTHGSRCTQPPAQHSPR